MSRPHRQPKPVFQWTILAARSLLGMNKLAWPSECCGMLGASSQYAVTWWKYAAHATGSLFRVYGMTHVMLSWSRKTVESANHRRDHMVPSRHRSPLLDFSRFGFLHATVRFVFRLCLSSNGGRAAGGRRCVGDHQLEPRDYSPYVRLF